MTEQKSDRASGTSPVAVTLNLYDHGALACWKVARWANVPCA